MCLLSCKPVLHCPTGRASLLLPTKNSSQHVGLVWTGSVAHLAAEAVQWGDLFPHLLFISVSAVTWIWLSRNIWSVINIQCEECEHTKVVNTQVTFLSLRTNACKMAQTRAFRIWQGAKNIPLKILFLKRWSSNLSYIIYNTFTRRVSQTGMYGYQNLLMIPHSGIYGMIFMAILSKGRQRQVKLQSASINQRLKYPLGSTLLLSHFLTRSKPKCFPTRQIENSLQQTEWAEHRGWW